MLSYRGVFPLLALGLSLLPLPEVAFRIKEASLAPDISYMLSGKASAIFIKSALRYVNICFIHFIPHFPYIRLHY